MKAQMQLVLVFLLGMAGAMAAQADDQKPAAKAAGQNQTPPSDKLDVSDLENKYWAPKDTDFSVVQNRTYTKENKLFLSLQFGPDISPMNYLTGNQVGLTANYFISERSGFQFTYLNSYLHSNSSYSDILNKGGHPDYGVMKNYYGLGYDWVPFYSKMSFLGKKIMYFDMAITPTIGFTDYSQQTAASATNQSAFTYGVDITQYYFFTNQFALRADLKNQWYNEKVLAYTTGDQIRNQNDREMIFLIGFTYFFGFGK